MAKAIILGGGGFIGAHLARHLTSTGFDVVALDLRAPAAPVDGVRYVRADVRDRIDPAGLPTNPDLFVNLAAVHREPGHAEHEYFETNEGGGRNALRLADDLDACEVVLTSSIAVYGSAGEPTDEARPPAPTTPYGRSKLLAELMVHEWAAADPRRRASIVRPAAVFGPGEGGNFTRLAAALRRERFVYPGRTDTIKGCGYVDDLVRAMTFMHDRAASVLTYNFAFPQAYALHEVCAAFCEVLQVDPPRRRVPLPVMRVAGRAGDVVPGLGRVSGLSLRRIEKLVTSTNIVPAVLAEHGFEFSFDLSSALRDWHDRAPVGAFV